MQAVIASFAKSMASNNGELSAEDKFGLVLGTQNTLTQNPVIATAVWVLVWSNGLALKLTHSEFILIEQFVRRPGRSVN